MNTLNGLIPCIISGGSGTRLWPVSRQNMPKPFMRMRDGQIIEDVQQGLGDARG